MKHLALFTLVIVLFSCKKKQVPDVDFAAEMRKFVIEISVHAKSVHPGFIVVPQNGVPLVSSDLSTSGQVDTTYLSAIDGIGQEDLYYGYSRDDKKTDESDRNEILPFLEMASGLGKTILVTDYCSTPEYVEDSYNLNQTAGFISFAAPDRNLTVIPDDSPFGENSDDITSLDQAKNFLYLINPTTDFADHTSFINALKATNYDVLIIDLFFENFQLTPSDLNELGTKANGGERLVLCYMSIGEAEDYRFYWDEDWNYRKSRPDWIFKENKRWRGNYKVFYWDPAWKEIILTGTDSYLGRILDAGFDGVYLDIIDAYEYFKEIKE